MTVKERYEESKKLFAAMGVDAYKAIERLSKVPISVHCWQGDDVKGFDREHSNKSSPRSLWRTSVLTK